MTVEKLIIAVPARLESSRFPRKVLSDIAGKPMLKRVIDQCKQVKESSYVVLCTDSEEISNLADSWGVRVLITSKSFSSGSERISSLVNELLSIAWGLEKEIKPTQKILDKTVIINVQADQPFVSPKLIEDIYNEFNNNKLRHEILTPIYLLKEKNIHDPNIVKVVTSSNGNALYFSRSAIPHVRGENPAEWHKFSNYYGHIGIYGFRANILANWENMPISQLERMERLEQLRLLESGLTIKTLLFAGDVCSIDTYEDLENINYKIHNNQTIKDYSKN